MSSCGEAQPVGGRTTAALRAAGVSQEEIDAYFAEATSGDYDHLLQTTMAWVDWEEPPRQAGTNAHTSPSSTRHHALPRPPAPARRLRRTHRHVRRRHL